jgi:hypothetical protein
MKFKEGKLNDDHKREQKMKNKSIILLIIVSMRIYWIISNFCFSNNIHFHLDIMYKLI